MMTGAAPGVRLLGDIWVGGGDGGAGPGADLGHVRQQSVLAVLLVQANRPVPATALLERAWGDRLPSRPLDTLYSYVSRLRRALASSAVMLERRRGGYLVTVDPALVDLHIFDELTRRARGETDERAALAGLERALGLWAGDALGALDTPWLNGVRHDLHCRREAAQRDRDELALRLGEHEAVLDDLLRRADRHPLDERLAGQALLALYRCGRQAAALTRYERLRRRLSEELGSDPGEPLRQLHRRILRADPSLTAVAATPATADPSPQPARPTGVAPTVPRQLPAPPVAFTGRVRELSELTAAAESVASTGGVATVAISGPGGIGKTWLALHWAHAHRDRFPDGQLYVDLRGFDPVGEPRDAAAVLRSFLAALGVPDHALPADPEGQAGLYRTMTARGRLLVLLDNARDSAQVLPLLPCGPGCAVLVTSRHRLTGLVATHAARLLTLGLMADDEAVELLRTRLGAVVAADGDALAGLLRPCGGLPLALGIVAARAATETQGGRPGEAGEPTGAAGAAGVLAALAAELDDGRTRLDALDTGDLGISLRAALTSSVRALSVPAVRLLGYLGLAPGADIGLAGVASTAGSSPAAVRSLVRELANAHVLAEDPPGRVRMHDLVRLYAAELTAPDADRLSAQARLLDHYLHAAHAADRLLQPARDAVVLPPLRPGVTVPAPTDRHAALAWFNTEYHNVLSAVRLAARTGFDRYAWQLAWAGGYLLDRRGNWDDAVAVHQAALECAQRLADDTALAHTHRGLARGYTWLARFDEATAHLHQALDAYRRLGDEAGQGFVYRSLARVSAKRGLPRQAIAADWQALGLFERAKHDPGRAQALNALGWHHSHVGEYERAVEYCQRAIAIQQRIGDPFGEALTWDSLALARARSGCYDQAITGYGRALRLLRDQADSYLEAVVTEHLGDVYAALHRRRAAEAAWRTSADQLTMLGHPDAPRVMAKLAADRATASTVSSSPLWTFGARDRRAAVS